MVRNIIVRVSRRERVCGHACVDHCGGRVELVRFLCSNYILMGGEYPLSYNSLILMLEMYRIGYSSYVV